MTPFADEIARCRSAQVAWSQLPIRDRLRPVREFRYLLVEQRDDLTAAVEADVRRRPDEVMATDIVPVAACAKFLQKRAAAILAPRKVGRPPLWLIRCRDVVHRRPRGVVGLIGTWNYPIFLNAVPILHALVAGNGILWKPSEQAPRTAAVLHTLFLRAGFPADLLQKLPATREAGPQLIEADLDFLHFTGSETVGRKLAARLGERLIPSTLELSGCDAMFVLADADPAKAARLAWYGSTLNNGQTCLGVRRVYAEKGVYGPLNLALHRLVKESRPVSLVMASEAKHLEQIAKEADEAGCDVVPDDHPPLAADEVPPTVIFNPQARPNLAANRDSLFAPLLTVTPFETREEALALHAESLFRLTASILSANAAAAQELAEKLPVGSVVINDTIAPTAHPETPFGGQRASGWGVTQGAEGLLEMTVPQTVTVRKGTFRPHAQDRGGQGDIARGVLRLTHARRWRDRWRGLWQMVRGMRRG
ncbi:aldehyde dehydrogenase family protein [Limnoglobus roseus]|uniref:Aldehyde dehydrogenase n=1 Tax=Limnoglobus roseus TaxID=2598579 RepID=A0A5C1AAR0_9BACT|nr:aldehyde dehydrogenase family protein [Limnoglobus roseus]QEL15655.1 aldehyde dehydrogenase [Limnoglobus roseus]